MCPSVCPCVRVFTFEVLFKLPEVGCPKFLEIRNPWGKVGGRSVLRFEIFCSKMVKIAAAKTVFFTDFFTSRSRMSNIFRYLDFLGKSSEKKWSQI